MTLNDLITSLQRLQHEGHGNLPVFYRHGASGDCGALSTPVVTTEQTESGPFDVDAGEPYVSVYAGN